MKKGENPIGVLAFDFVDYDVNLSLLSQREGTGCLGHMGQSRRDGDYSRDGDCRN